MKNLVLRFILGVALAVLLAAPAAAQTKAGQIRAAKIEGEVSKLVNGSPVALKNGAQLKETDVVVTGKASSVVLVFMNGSSIKLGPDSRLVIDEFKMDPLAEDITLSPTMKGEPSVSKTALNLSYGELVGDVKKLNASSTYSVKTPVGAAGIRGTIFRIVYRPASDGKAFFTVSTADGHVVMEGVTAEEIPIDTGKEVVVTVDIPTEAAPGETPKPPATPEIVTQDIPTTTAALITAASESIATTVQKTTFQPTPPADSSTDETKTDDTKKDDTKKDETKTDDTNSDTNQNSTPPPPPQPPQPPLTPGAGG